MTLLPAEINGHAAIAPSAMDITVKCFAHVQMAAPFLNAPRTEEQLEGDAAHHIAADYVRGKLWFDGAMTPQGIKATKDMLWTALLYRSTINRLDKSDTVAKRERIERKVQITRVHETHCAGTPDYAGYDPVQHILDLVDLKYGHDFVSEFENWQLMPYASGIIDDLGIREDGLRIRMTIVQPRAYSRRGSVRTWTILGHQLRPYINIAHHAAHKSLEPNPIATAGVHCLYCPGRHVCETAQHAVGKLIEYSSRPQPVAMDPQAVGAELATIEDAITLLRARKTGLMNQADGFLRAGQRVVNYGLEPTAGKLDWVKPVDQVAALGDLYEIELRKPLDVVTPTQAKSLGMPDTIIEPDFAKRLPGAAKIARRDTDETRRIFGTPGENIA